MERLTKFCRRVKAQNMAACNSVCCQKTRNGFGKLVDFLKKHSQNVLLVMIVLFMIIGVVIGILVRGVEPRLTPTQIMYLGFPGDLLMRMLKMMILPLIISSLISGLANLDLKSSGRMGGRAVLYYMTTTFLAVILGIILVASIQPGLKNAKETLIGGESKFKLVRTSDKILDLVRSMFPDNLITSTFQQVETQYDFHNCSDLSTAPQICNSSKIDKHVKINIVTTEEETVWFTLSVVNKPGLNIMGLLIFSVVFGVILGGMEDRAKPLRDFFDCLSEASMKIVNLIIWYSPIGVCFLIAAKLAEIDDLEQMLIGLGFYMLTVLVGLAIHGLIVLPLIYLIFTRKNPLIFIKGVIQALVTGFATASSSATLPVTMKCLEDNNKLDKRVVSFVIPVGATINMDGTALYEAVAAIFIAQINGWPLTIGDYITTSITATIASVGAAAVPSAGLITLIIVVNAIGLPDDDIVYIVAIDWFLDRFRTAVNILGDSLGAGIVDHYSAAELNQRSDNVDDNDGEQDAEALPNKLDIPKEENGTHNGAYEDQAVETHM